MEDEYAEFKGGIISVFDGTNPTGATGIKRAIWFYEGGLSSLLMDNVYNDGDSIIDISREVSFTIEEGKISDEDFVSEFTTDYNQLSNHLNNSNIDLSYSSTDVRFVSLEGNVLQLTINTRLLVNGFNSPWDAPDVPSATHFRYGGADAICGAISGGGAWKSVQSQARSVIPGYSGAYVNCIHFNSDPFAINQSYVDGSFLYGQPNETYWPYPAPVLGCVTPSQQDHYAQEIADQVYDLMGKRYYWSGAKDLRVIDSTWLVLEE